MTNPYIYKNWRQKNREAAERSRNTALNDVYKKFGLPKNMANKEIGQKCHITMVAPRKICILNTRKL
jgi:hypothetical protein